MSLEDIRTGKQILNANIASRPITSDVPVAPYLRRALLSQIAQAGRRNGLVELAQTLIDPVNPGQWLDEQLKGVQPHELLPELIAMLRMFERISQSLKKRVAWFRTRMKEAVDPKGLQTTVEHRIDHFLMEWIERLEDTDFNALLAELEDAKELPIADRAKLAERCYKDLCDLVRKREIYEEDYESSRYSDEDVKRERLAPERLDDIRWVTTLREKRLRGGRAVWRSHKVTFNIVESVRHIRREAQIRSAIGTVDAIELERDASRYGAKGANLLAARKAIGGLNKTVSGKVRVPFFRLFDVGTFERWRRGEDITDTVQEAYRWMGGRAMYVRSSAVHSEDRENITGAGIYDSVPLPKGSSFEDFRAAVGQVYESTDAPKAKEYRELNGVTATEQMGIVVQEMVSEGLENRRKGYINTVRPHVPGHLEIVIEDHRLRCICTKEKIEQQMWRGDHVFGDIAYYQIDAGRYPRVTNTMATLAHLGQLLEMHFGYPVQVEFISGGMDVNLLQVRHLPSQLLRTAPVQFPEGKQSLHECDAIGVGDMILDVLSPDRRNADRKGVVIFYRSCGMFKLHIEQYFPKEGAVIILCPSGEDFGHIETLCVERGLLCVFHSGDRPESAKDNEISPALRKMLSQVNHRCSEITCYADFAGHRQIHIVANGLKAKIYPVDAK